MRRSVSTVDILISRRWNGCWLIFHKRTTDGFRSYRDFMTAFAKLLMVWLFVKNLTSISFDWRVISSTSLQIASQIHYQTIPGYLKIAISKLTFSKLFNFKLWMIRLFTRKTLVVDFFLKESKSDMQILTHHLKGNKVQILKKSLQWVTTYDEVLVFFNMSEYG